MEVQSGYWGDPVERPHGKGMVLKLYKKRSSTVSWPSWTDSRQRAWPMYPCGIALGKKSKEPPGPAQVAES